MIRRPEGPPKPIKPQSSLREDVQPPPPHPTPCVKLVTFGKFGCVLGTFKQGVSKQGVMTFAWRPGSQHDVSATRGADSVLARDCRAQFGLPSTRRGCRICVTVRLPVRPRGETMYWQAHANTPLSVTPLFKCALVLQPRPFLATEPLQFL